MRWGLSTKKKKIEPILGRGAARQRTSPIVMLALSGKKWRFPPRKIIAGLRWLMPRDAARGKEGAMRMALQPEYAADFVAIRETAVYEQFGLGWTGAAPLKQRPFERWEAGAAVLADVLNESKWIGVWPVEDAAGKKLWWFVGVNADELLPDGDVLFDNEEAATERVVAELQNLNQGSDDTIVFAPESWPIKNSRAETWEYLLEGATGPKVQVVQEAKDDTRQKVIVVIGAAVIFGGVIWGMNYLADAPPPPAPTTPRNVPPAPAPTPAPAPERKIAAPPPPGSETAIRADQWIADCLAAAGPLFHPAPGWMLKRISCANNTAKVELDREPGGQHDWLIRAVAGRPTSKGQMLAFTDPAHAAISLAMTVRPGRGQEDLWTEAETSQWFAALAERTGLAIETHAIAATASPPPSSPSSPTAAIAGLISTVEPQAAPTYRTIGFTIVSPFSPAHWSEWLVKIPGLQMTGLKAPVDNQLLGDWTLEGVIYVGL